MKLNILKTLALVAALTVSASAMALEVGDAAPCVVLDHQLPANGGVATHCIREPNQAGQFVLLEFFSILCSDCAKNQPRILDLGDSVIETATTRFVSIDRDALAIDKFLMAAGEEINIEVAYDTNRDAKKAYGVNITPTLFILNQNNEIVYKHEGLLKRTDVQTIKALVGAQK